MKILHTSDWHLGKKLETAKRIDEQKKFIDTLENIVENENPQIILVAGDIFDTPNPSSEAEGLFFDAMKKISNFGKRAIIIIPGNHDGAERLAASKNLAREFGIIIYEKPFEVKEVGKYGEFQVVKSFEGGLLLNIDKEEIYIYSLPYTNESVIDEEYLNIETFKYKKNPDEISSENIDYSKKIGIILKNGIDFVENLNIPKIIMSHLFIAGSSGDGDEKPIELGGSKAVNLGDLPEADYIALGHIHKPMKYISKRACYSGSPIEYRVTENKYSKKIFMVDVKGKLQTDIKEIQLENYKPIKIYEVSSIEEGITLSKEFMEKNQWIYLKIHTDKYLSSKDIREINKNKNIVEIIPILEGQENENGQNINIDYSQLNIKDAFIEFYKSEDGIEPSGEVVDLFLKLLEEDK
ncbi:MULTISPECIES: exonuclease subunit SbcD [Fusobacterium]|uniref:metallophosphoesterase family protein n=1 Tax=Fusobacterium TaxID=848 RepID=UPI001477509C|nr:MULTISPECIES: exonuclease subunit SbcD [Fusobacterium]NME34981.1 exonuclease subunit SbcD [Fusobacterium sp. FSA-380-WT-3A]